MRARFVAIVLYVIAPLLPSAAAWSQTKPTDLPTAIVDRYLAAMQQRHYKFLSADDLARRRDNLHDLVAANLKQPLDAEAQTKFLAGVDACMTRVFYNPSDYTGMGPNGEEWSYLIERDLFRTFEYHVWIALMRAPLTEKEAQRRDDQHQWMRQYLVGLTLRQGDAVPVEGMRREDVKAWVQAKLEAAFNDPLDPLYDPMDDAGYALFQNRFKSYSNGITSDFQDMRVFALQARFPNHPDGKMRDGRAYVGAIPFKGDAVIDLWGNGPHLCFASNADFRGNHGSLGSYQGKSVACDVVRCDALPSPNADQSGFIPNSPEMNQWLAKENRGDLTFDETAGNVLAVRGATFAMLPAKDYFEADAITDRELLSLLKANPLTSVSVKPLRPMNGAHGPGRDKGEFFLVVQTRENRLAVVSFSTHEFGGVMFWCRPRPLAPLER